MITSCPPWAIFCAANMPAGPAPITKTVFTWVPSRIAGATAQSRYFPLISSALLLPVVLLSLTIRAHACPSFIHFPAGGHVLLGLFKQLPPLGGASLHGVTRLIVEVIFQGTDGALYGMGPSAGGFKAAPSSQLRLFGTLGCLQSSRTPYGVDCDAGHSRSRRRRAGFLAGGV